MLIWQNCGSNLYVRLKTAGYQSALMVPTEILAEQHAESLIQLFGNTMNVALLTGSVKGKKRRLL